jgi:hypothetical protein
VCHCEGNVKSEISKVQGTSFRQCVVVRKITDDREFRGAMAVFTPPHGGRKQVACTKQIQTAEIKIFRSVKFDTRRKRFCV